MPVSFIAALALPVFEEVNQCKDGETFLEVIILITSPFIRLIVMDFPYH